MSRTPLLIILLIYGTLNACKAPAITASPDSRLTVRQLKKALEERAPRYDWFSSRVNIELDGTELPIRKATASLRMKRDSILWISISALAGIEAIRILATPDSVKIIDRLNNRFISRGLSEFPVLAAEGITFPLLQELLAGGAPLPAGKSVLTSDETHYILKTENKILTRTLWVFPAFVVDKMVLEGNTLRGKIVVLYRDYRKLGDYEFPAERKLTLDSGNPVTVTLKYGNLKYGSPLPFPFTVPPDYRHADK